jgi:hypothetical protein
VHIIVLTMTLHVPPGYTYGGNDVKVICCYAITLTLIMFQDPIVPQTSTAMQQLSSCVLTMTLHVPPAAALPAADCNFTCNQQPALQHTA